MKIETGVMVINGDLGWGVKYEDRQVTEYGWVSPEQAIIANPKFAKRTTDFISPQSWDAEEIKKGKLVMVERVTTVDVLVIGEVK